MAFDPKWYDENDVLLGAPLAINANSGTPSNPITLRLYNDKDIAGADPFPSSLTQLLIRSSSTGLPSSSDHPVVDRYYTQAKITQGLGGKTVPASDWQFLGDGRYLALPSLGSGEGVEIQVRVSTPIDVQSIDASGTISTFIETFITRGPGLTEIQGDGIYLGIGDPLVSSFLRGTPTLSNPAGDDDNVQVGPTTYILSGVVLSVLGQLVNIPPSTATFSRYVLISVDNTGSINTTDGAETTSVLTDDDKPSTPTGELGIAYVEVSDSGIIAQEDISDIWQLSGYAMTVSGLNVVVSSGKGLVDNSITLNQVSQSATLTASSTSRLWLLRDGSLAVTTTAAPPDGTRPLLLARFLTDSTNVLSMEDLRRYIGFRIYTVSFRWGGVLSVDDFRYAINPCDGVSYILPMNGVRAALGVPGTVSGQTKFLAQVDSDYDDTWADDVLDTVNSPEIPFDATDLRHISSTPKLHLIPPGARIRAWIDEIPGGSDAADATLDIIVVEAGR